MTNKDKLTNLKEKLVKMTGEYCRNNVNEEYETLCKKLIDKLARKRVVPFTVGKMEIWAAAIVHAIGTTNFLFDKSSKPYVAPEDISKYFNVPKSTLRAKSKVIRELLKIDYYDPDFSTAHMAKNNPFAKLRMVNGFIVTLD